jgi:hypothetical protein
MKRKVIESKVTHFTRGGSIRDTLECGHTMYVKLSQGQAAWRICKTCQHLKNGGKTIYTRHDGTRWTERLSPEGLVDRLELGADR